MFCTSALYSSTTRYCCVWHFTSTWNPSVENWSCTVFDQYLPPPDRSDVWAETWLSTSPLQSWQKPLCLLSWSLLPLLCKESWREVFARVRWDLTYCGLSVTSEKGVLGRGRGLPGQDWGRHLLSQAIGRHLHLTFSRFCRKEDVLNFQFCLNFCARTWSSMFKSALSALLYSAEIVWGCLQSMARKKVNCKNFQLLIFLYSLEMDTFSHYIACIAYLRWHQTKKIASR